MFKEFREFIMRGNVIDLAVGIIIGAAFTTIVNSLVTDIITPPLGQILNGVDFTDLFIVLGEGSYASLAEAQEAGAATINYGVFINAVINFLLVAIALFLLIRFVNRLNRKAEVEEEAQAPAEPTTDEKILETLTKLNATLEKMDKSA